MLCLDACHLPPPLREHGHDLGAAVEVKHLADVALVSLSEGPANCKPSFGRPPAKLLVGDVAVDSVVALMHRCQAFGERPHRASPPSTPPAGLPGVSIEESHELEVAER